jgi:hypothetical protein
MILQKKTMYMLFRGNNILIEKNDFHKALDLNSIRIYFKLNKIFVFR